MKRASNQSSRILAVLIGLTAIAVGGQAGAQSGTWSAKTPMPTNRYGLAAGVVNNIFYAVGGFNNETGQPMEATVEAYDPTTDAWSVKAPMPTGRVFAAAGVVDGILYVIGGTNFVGDMFATVEAYDPVIDAWTTRAPMPAPRYNQAVGVVNGILYAAGGWDGGFVGRVPDLWAYDPATDTWTARAPMPTGRMSLAVGVVDGTLYAVGGEINGNVLVGSVEAYDPATNTWTTKTSMPTPRHGLAIGVASGTIYAMGGEVGSGLLSTVEAYNPATDTWLLAAPMPTPRSFFGAAAIDDILFAAGGTISNTGLATLEAYTPLAASTIAIDIKPDSFPNSINPRSRGVIPVAILTTPDFDATTVDPGSVKFGPKQAPPSHSAWKDVDRDGDLDMLLHFRTQGTGIACGDTSAVLAGFTGAGQEVQGSDAIETVGCKKLAANRRAPGRRK